MFSVVFGRFLGVFRAFWGCSGCFRSFLGVFWVFSFFFFWGGGSWCFQFFLVSFWCFQFFLGGRFLGVFSFFGVLLLKRGFGLRPTKETHSMLESK